MYEYRFSIVLEILMYGIVVFIQAQADLHPKILNNSVKK